MEKRKKIKLCAYSVLYLLLFVAGIFAVINYDWMNLFLVLLTSFILHFSYNLTKNVGFEFTNEIEIAIVVLVYTSLFLGETQSFYQKFWWWDIMLHTFSGVVIALAAFLLVYILNKKKAFSMSPVFVCLFAFSFAVTLGFFWEVFEFFVDGTLGTNMQKTGLSDTMSDLIVNMVGAAVVSITGYFYLKYGTQNFVSRSINKFLKNNQDYFNSK